MLFLPGWFGGWCSYLGGLGEDVGETLGDGTGEDLLGGTGGGKSLFGIVGESLDWNKRCAQNYYICMEIILLASESVFFCCINVLWMFNIK